MPLMLSIRGRKIYDIALLEEFSLIEAIKSLLNNTSFIAIVSTIIGAVSSHILTIRHERKKDRTASNKALQKENEDLRSQLEIYEATSSSQTGDFLVRKKDNEPICPVCWRAEHKAIPIYENNDTGYYTCGKCGQTGIFNRKKVQQLDAERESFNQQLSDTIMTSPYPEQDSSDFYEHYLNP